MLNFIVVVFSTLLLASCSSIVNLEQREQEDLIRISCGKACKTLTSENGSLTFKEEKLLKMYVKQFDSKQPILVAACNDQLQSKQFAFAVIDYLKLQHKKAYMVRQVMPYKRIANDKICINLLKGRLRFHLPNCKDTKNYQTNLLVGYDFGCSSQYNLLQMLKDPNDLLRVADSYNIKNGKF